MGNFGFNQTITVIPHDFDAISPQIAAIAQDLLYLKQIYLCTYVSSKLDKAMKQIHANSIDDYIASFPVEIQTILEQIRFVIQQAAPEAQEAIKYAMPTFVFHGNLVHFAAFSHHIGFYPVPTGIEAFKEELSVYKSAKGSVQFPLNKPMPLNLIAAITKFRVEENREKAEKKKAARKCKNGHTYYKTSDCPTCPICEQEAKPQDNIFSSLGAPARRALENNGITNLTQLAELSENEVLAWHGMGKSSIPTLQQALAAQGLRFKE